MQGKVEVQQQASTVYYPSALKGRLSFGARLMKAIAFLATPIDCGQCIIYRTAILPLAVVRETTRY